MFGVVINQDGFKVEFVHILDDGNIDNYVLKDGEQIVTEGWQIANAMLKPRWVGLEWIETATEEEIGEANYIPPQPLTEIELLQNENKLLKAQVQANADISDFHEELIVELAMMVYQ